MIRDLIEICRELELRRIDVVKGVALCVAMLPVVYIGFLALWFILSGVADIVEGLRQ